MASGSSAPLPSPALARRALPAWRPAAVDAAVAAAALLLLGALTLLTPAFTDYEAEAEPALLAFARGELGDGIARLPLYGTAVLLMAVPARIAALLGGADLAIFRAVAVPGAIAMAGLALVAASWLRGAGRPRREQLAAVVLIAASPGIAHAWQVGHPEEPMIAGLGLCGVLLAQRDGHRWAIAGGAVVGLAAGAKLWAIVLVPVAIVAAPTLAAQLRVAAAAVVAGALALAPTALALRDNFTAVAQSTGGDGVFSVGNLWWFLGRPNPAWQAGELNPVVQLHTYDNSPRLGPEWVGAYAHEGIVLLAGVLAAAWWWRQRAAPAGPERTASVLALAAAVLWWRALPDPWLQPYYLTAALAAMVLMDARLGRLPVAAAIGWAALWLLSVQNAPAMSLQPDVRSALLLSWSVPLGIWLVIRAMRPVR